jgi:apolipoprotein N-acyltransferase
LILRSELPPLYSTASTQSREGYGLRALAQGVILAWDWRRRAIAFAAGAVGALALPPFDVLPAMFVPMMTAVWLIDGSALASSRGSAAVRSMRSAFAVGWWWGFGYFVAGLWWLGAAFLVEADKFAWALPLGVLALPAGLAFFPAIGFAIARALWTSGLARILALGLGLSASEWLRTLVLTGFPWNEFGMALGQNLLLAQLASVVGLHGLTILAVAIFASPATLADQPGGRWLPWSMIAGLAALAMLAIFGALRLHAPDAALTPHVKLRIMQPNVAQDASFRPQNKDAIMRRYLALSDRAASPTSTGVADSTHLIWPESAFPFLLARDPQALARIAELLRGGATTLITGAARVAEPVPGDKRAHYFNSIQVIDGRGALLDRYDKIHLVPFGEYLPYADFFDRFGITQFIRFPGGFDPGVGPRLLHAPGLPDALPLICYEAVFPQETGSIFNPDERRAGWMLNVTDDAWFGLTPGPYQHFAQARLRAIEQGLPLVRAANTGISAVVDGLGRVVAELPLGVEGVLDSGLPAPAAPTLYSRFGALAPLALWTAFLFVCLVSKRRRAK